MKILRIVVFEGLKETGEWQDLIIQNLLPIHLRILEIDELVVKRPEEGADL